MAIAHLALKDALQHIGLATIPDSRTQSPLPAPEIEVSLSSPFNSRCLTPISSRGPSPAPSLTPSFHTAHSGTQRRPSPAPITIPTATADEPLFSSYPYTPSAIKDEATAKPANLTLTPPEPPLDTLGLSVRSASYSGTSTGPSAWDPPTDNRDHIRSTTRLGPQSHRLPMSNLGRRRSTTSVHLSSRLTGASSSIFGDSTIRLSRRRSSLNTDDNGIERWREFGAMSTQFETCTTTTAYDFLRDDSNYTLQSVSMVSGYRPLSPPLPTPPPRSSSLVHSPDALLRLAALSLSTATDGIGDDPDVGMSRFAKEATADINAAADAVSFVSEPMTSSPSAMTKSLPSTKTSLSRSARSGKEGCTDIHNDDDDDLAPGGAAATTTSATATNCGNTCKRGAGRERVLTEKRRMIILEIVETEITYVHDLQALVHIYLPQLSALPHVPERIHSSVVRNTSDLLQFHIQFAAHLVDILKYNGMMYEEASPGVVDTVTKRVADLFVREATSFSLYSDYCAGSTTASALLRSVTHRADYDAFEKRCQYVASTTANPTLRDLLYSRPPRPMRCRHRFQDLLISPVQRVCRYPLLLAALLADVNDQVAPTEAISAVDRAQAIMRAVAGNADDARQYKEAELKTIAIAERFEPHPAVSEELLGHLGICRLGGALDILYHHPQFAPLEAPAKVKYLAAFLYRGYLILAKIKRGNRFEIKHHLPLEAFELIDITEGFLPHSIRLTLCGHNFDLSATCDAEKEVWANELVAARNESIVPPFELPSSVALFALRQAVSAPTSDEGDNGKVDHPAKRHTLMVVEGTEDSPASSTPGAETETPSEYRRSQTGTLLLRRASATQRLQVDRALSDVIFESLATARSKAQLQYAGTSDSRRSSSLFDTPILRRRLSFAAADSRTSLDVLAAPEVRGAVMPGRLRPRPRTMVSTDNLDVEGGGLSGDISRNTSFSSVNEIPLRGRPSSVSLRRAFDMTLTPARAERHSHRRQSHSISSLNLDASRHRARSAPNSPVYTPGVLLETSSRAEPALAGESMEKLTSPPLTAKPFTAPPRRHVRIPSDDSFVMVPEIVNAPPVMSALKGSPPMSALKDLPMSVPKGSPPRASSTGSLRRSVSGFFNRRSPPGSALDISEESESSKSTVRTLVKTVGTLSEPSTPNGFPTTPKRRRSMRLFGQLRGFTPI